MANENIAYSNGIDTDSQKYEANPVAQKSYDVRQQQLREQQMKAQIARASFRNARQYSFRL